MQDSAFLAFHELRISTFSENLTLVGKLDYLLILKIAKMTDRSETKLRDKYKFLIFIPNFASLHLNEQVAFPARVKKQIC